MNSGILRKFNTKYRFRLQKGVKMHLKFFNYLATYVLWFYADEIRLELFKNFHDTESTIPEFWHIFHGLCLGGQNLFILFLRDPDHYNYPKLEQTVPEYLLLIVAIGIPFLFILFYNLWTMKPLQCTCLSIQAIKLMFKYIWP